MGLGGGVVGKQGEECKDHQKQEGLPYLQDRYTSAHPPFFSFITSVQAGVKKPDHKMALRDKVTPMTYSYKRSAPGRATAKLRTYSSISNLAKTLTY